MNSPQLTGGSTVTVTNTVSEWTDASGRVWTECPEHGVKYVWLQPALQHVNGCSKRQEEAPGGVIIDYDADDKIIGIEFL